MAWNPGIPNSKSFIWGTVVVLAFPREQGFQSLVSEAAHLCSPPACPLQRAWHLPHPFGLRFLSCEMGMGRAPPTPLVAMGMRTRTALASGGHAAPWEAHFSCSYHVALTAALGFQGAMGCPPADGICHPQVPWVWMLLLNLYHSSPSTSESIHLSFFFLVGSKGRSD